MWPFTTNSDGLLSYVRIEEVRHDLVCLSRFGKIDVIPEGGVWLLTTSRIHRITVIEHELRQLCLRCRRLSALVRSTVRLVVVERVQAVG